MLTASSFAQGLQLCLTLRDLLNCSLPGSSVHGIIRARILECVAISSSRESSQPRDWTCLSCVTYIGKWIIYHYAIWEALWLQKPAVKLAGTLNKGRVYAYCICSLKYIKLCIYACMHVWLFLTSWTCQNHDNLMDSSWSLPGSSVHGIFQARILEWVALPSFLQGIFLTQG